MNGNGSVDADLYVHHNVALGAGLRVDETRWSYVSTEIGRSGETVRTVERLRLPAYLDVGLRIASWRFDVGYTVTPQHVVETQTTNSMLPPRQERWEVPFWAGVTLRARAVVFARYDVSAAVNVLDGGAEGLVRLGAALTRRWFLTLVFSGGRTQVRDVIDDTVGGRIDIAGWYSRHFGFGFGYAPTYASTYDRVSRTAVEQWHHTFNLWFFSRLL